MKRTALTGLALLSGLGLASAVPATGQGLRQIEVMRGTNAFCVLDMPDGNYHYVYEGRFDRSNGTLRKINSRLYLRHVSWVWREMKAELPAASKAYVERIYTVDGPVRSTVIRIERIQAKPTVGALTMVLASGGQKVTRQMMAPFSLYRPAKAEFAFGAETRAMFDRPFSLTFNDRHGHLIYQAEFKPDPAFEAKRGKNLVTLGDAQYEGKPAAAAQLPKTCRIERS